jgi:RND family efflux transporter MFP subunit
MTTRKYVLVFLFVGLLGFTWYSWDSAYEQYAALEPESEQATTVFAKAAKKEALNEWVLLDGVVEVAKKLQLTFEVAGRVIRLGEGVDGKPLQEGDRVSGPKDGKPGTLIAELDARDYKEQLRIAQADLRQARNNVDIAKAAQQQVLSRRELAAVRLQRISKLSSAAAVSLQHLDEVRAEHKLALADEQAASAQLAAASSAVNASREAVALAQRNVERARIFAPWDGTIARLNIKVGDYAAADALDTRNQDAMTATFPVTLVDGDSYKIVTEVPLQQGRDLKESSAAQIRQLSQRPGAGEEDSDESWMPARLSSLSPILSPSARTMRAKLETASADVRLADGELVQVRILKSQRQTLVIPVQSVLYRNNEAVVFVVGDEGKVKERRLRTGVRDGDRVEVLSGLSAGELVVTEGRHRLIDGDAVRVLDANNGSGQ